MRANQSQTESVNIWIEQADIDMILTIKLGDDERTVCIAHNTDASEIVEVDCQMSHKDPLAIVSELFGRPLTETEADEVEEFFDNMQESLSGYPVHCIYDAVQS